MYLKGEWYTEIAFSIENSTIGQQNPLQLLFLNTLLCHVYRSHSIAHENAVRTNSL